MLSSLIEGLEKESSEFVRPALTRSIAAQGSEARARAALVPLVARGDNYFRGAVIEALGDYSGTYALAEIWEVAKLDGPLQDDAVLALGKIGDSSTVALLVNLQKTASRELQPAIVAALCMLKQGCEAADEYFRKTLTYASDHRWIRGALARGRPCTRRSGCTWTGRVTDRALRCGDQGAGGSARHRSLSASGSWRCAIRRWCSQPSKRSRIPPRPSSSSVTPSTCSNEDFEEERFFVEMRRAYWAAAAGSSRRRITETLIQKLEF